jgi:hypothetical protein
VASTTVRGSLATDTATLLRQKRLLHNCHSSSPLLRSRLERSHNTMLLMIVYGPELVRLETDGQEIIHIVLPKHYAQLLRRCWRKRKTKKGLFS